MRLDESIQDVGRRLDAGKMLVSDAIIALITILRARLVSNSPDFSRRHAFYEEALEALNRELLGYENAEWDLSTGFRRCQIRTAKMIDRTITYIPNPVSDAAFYMMWGSQQVEAFLSGVMDLSVLESGNKELVDDETRLLEESNPLFHSESGVEDIWVVFTGAELLRLYLQLKSALSGICEALLVQARNDNFVPVPQIPTSTQVFF